MTYHVVCHDCTLEELTHTKEEAQFIAERHKDEAWHNAEYKQIEP